MYADVIYASASALAGESELLRSLCRAAGAELEKRLRPGVSVSDCEDAFVAAAALIAVAGYKSAGIGADDVTAFRAGDVSVTKRGGADGLAAGARLRDEAERLMMPYVCDGAFDFKSVVS